MALIYISNNSTLYSYRNRIFLIDKLYLILQLTPANTPDKTPTEYSAYRGKSTM